MTRPKGGEPLTARELEIATLAADALTSGQIAARLFISKRTVDTHLLNIYAKTGARSRVQLVLWLRRAGIAGSGQA